MYRYSEDTSTSSEDDTSTAGAVSRPTTADMCRSMVRNGVTVQRCTGCGYTSNRQANVTRHYRRIHAQLKKHRKCSLCGEVFETKWKFYKHCNKHHPSLRQACYTTTHLYKINQTKAKSWKKSVSRPRRRVESRRKSAKEGMATRSSTRLRNRQMTTVEPLSTSCSSTEAPSMMSEESFVSSGSSADKVAPMISAESFLSSSTSENDSPLKNTDKSFDGHMSDHFNYNENVDPNFVQEIAHLPIKKRYLIERRYFADITNNNVEVQKNPYEDNSTVQMSVRELNLSKVDENQRAYINDIDFDELDAILQLHNMIKNV